MRRERRGSATTEIIAPGQVLLNYLGLDEVLRCTALAFEPPPRQLSTGMASYQLALAPGAFETIDIAVECREGEHAPVPPPFRRSMRAALQARKTASRGQSAITTSNAIFNEMLCRCTSDLAMLITQTEHGPYPYAGIPWYSTTFGRDGIITAIQTLWCRPDIARGVLRHLAALRRRLRSASRRRAREDPARSAKRRDGATGRGAVPPLLRQRGFHAAIRAAGRPLSRSHWRSRPCSANSGRTSSARIAWIDGPGDPDGDGFVEYHRADDDGLINQGWKDSHDSIFHADGTLADGPIALCEVQGYVLRRQAGRQPKCARRLGHRSRGRRLERAGRRCCAIRFEDAFLVR